MLIKHNRGPLGSFDSAEEEGGDVDPAWNNFTQQKGKRNRKEGKWITLWQRKDQDSFQSYNSTRTHIFHLLIKHKSSKKQPGWIVCPFTTEVASWEEWSLKSFVLRKITAGDFLSEICTAQANMCIRGKQRVSAVLPKCNLFKGQLHAMDSPRCSGTGCWCC